MESLLIAIAVCIDAFTVGISYGVRNINIPKISLLVIDIVTVIILSASMLVGSLLENFLANNITTVLSFLILVTLGASFIVEGYIKQLVIQKQEKKNKKLADIKLNKLGIKICIFADSVLDSSDVAGNINCKEALYLGMALSLDSLGVGLGSAIGTVNHLQVIGFVLILNLLALIFGVTIGKKIKKYNKNLKTFWISGGILIALGISKLT